MLNELQIFEANFADYIKDSEIKKQYTKNSFRLLNELIHTKTNTYIDVLSFNYSLDTQAIVFYKEI